MNPSREIIEKCSERCRSIWVVQYVEREFLLNGCIQAGLYTIVVYKFVITQESVHFFVYMTL
jgi:hypothetical protein